MSSGRSDESTTSRYVVGFDLGTTNSAVCYVDTEQDPWRVQTFRVPQLVAPGQVEARETLPSFLYQPAPGELPADALRLPWHGADATHAVGFFARDHGANVPGRLIASAKSWLCHSGVDRTAPVLPWHGAADVERLSPVDVSARYLEHVRGAWGARFPEHPLAEQDFVLTLPASFDEVARELTVKAAARAGLPRVVLIEEPQAAFYAWIDAHADDWHRRVEPGQKILVCDVGGGTSDFTLIRVRAGEGGKVRFHRVAVGNHLILGGDNLDLALAQHIERRLAGEEGLEPRQWAVLVRSCRHVKESLLSDDAPERLTVNVAGSGSRLIGGGLRLEVTREEACKLLVDGFFPQVKLEDKPLERRSGFQEFGLPYAPDPAVTRYLAAFLTAHRHVALDETDVPPGRDPARPDVVLLGGGVFASQVLRRRLLESLKSWFRTSSDPDWEPLVLANDRLDLAVARGAAYYGMVRRGQGVRIAAGLARTYYVGVAGTAVDALAKADDALAKAADPSSPEPALGVGSGMAVCLVPAGMEPGQDLHLTERQFDLLVSQPVEFPLYVSSTRLTDAAGELVAVDREQMRPLPPMRTVLRTRRKSDSPTISVHLHARLTEIGTLDLWCSQVDGRGSWRLQFDVRSATQTDVAAHEASGEREGFVDEATWERLRPLIVGTFGPHGKERPEGLMKRLSRASGMNRREWPMSLLRRIWETLMEAEPGRRRSQLHEARWLNLLGFALRPGYGLAVDDWRVAQTWRTLQGKLIHAAAMCRAEWWILWRRIAGGLGAGQQQALADPLVGLVRGLHRQLTTGKGGGGFNVGSHEAAEVLQLLGSLELLPVNMKIELGDMLLDLLPRRKMEPVRPAVTWAIGRIAARVPVYGPLNSVVPADAAVKWLKRLTESAEGDPVGQLAVMQISRRTEDRYRDLPEKQRAKVLKWLTTQEAPAHFIELVRDGGQLDTEEQGLVFGEALPKGLRIL
ncbi:MAG TPA: Hsp70 family protein [Thermoguttaceae bacterium]|nr:Hsp70 family protein [Thermoguttaceae bacterium]